MAVKEKSAEVGFAEFAAQLVAEVHEAVLAAQAHQEDRRAQIAELASMPVERFARVFITRDQVEAELARLFPARGGKAHFIRAGMSYRPATASRPEAPPIQAKLSVRLSEKDVHAARGERFELTAAGERTVRETARIRLAEAQIKALRQATSQGLPRVIVNSGRVNVKLAFSLLDLDSLSATRRKNGLSLNVEALTKLIGKKGVDRSSRLRVVVRPIDTDALLETPSASAGFGELDLTLKTV